MDVWKETQLVSYISTYEAWFTGPSRICDSDIKVAVVVVVVVVIHIPPSSTHLSPSCHFRMSVLHPFAPLSQTNYINMILTQ